MSTPTLNDILMDESSIEECHMDRLYNLMTSLYPLIDSGDMALTERVIATLVFALPDDPNIMDSVERSIANILGRLL